MANDGWMLFVDGENLTIRAKELAQREKLNLGAIPDYYLENVFVWLPEFSTAVEGVYAFQLFPLGNRRATRAYYYTSVIGDPPKMVDVRQRLRNLGFDPQVFKRLAGTAKSKGVDIALTKDMLSHAFLDHYQDAVLVAGDGDYLPLVEEVKRRGKRVYILFFADEGLGLAPEMRLMADLFTDLTPVFVNRWRTREGTSA